MSFSVTAARIQELKVQRTLTGLLHLPRGYGLEVGENLVDPRHDALLAIDRGGERAQQVLDRAVADRQVGMRPSGKIVQMLKPVDFACAASVCCFSLGVQADGEQARVFFVGPGQDLHHCELNSAELVSDIVSS